MNRFFWLLCCFFSQILVVHAQLSDDFSDGDFTSNPTWSGEEAFFAIDDAQLRSNGPDTPSSFYLSTPNTRIDNAEWRFLIDLDFNPTGSNQVRVYLASDQANLGGSLNGYYVELGQTSDDFIQFYRQDGDTPTLLFTGTSALSGNLEVRLSILRDNAGNWEVRADPAGGENFISQGDSFNDNTYPTTAHFGVFCTYTTTSRRDQYRFDDFYIGDEILDEIPPTLSNLQILSANQLALTFSEPIAISAAENTANYSVDGGVGNPSQAQRSITEPTLITLTFVNNFVDTQDYTLSIQNLTDPSGNTILPNPTTSDFTFFEPFEPSFREVVINEILPDPNPPVALPEAEFIELFNTADRAVDLDGWNLSGASLPAFLLAPFSYVIICDADDVSLFAAFGDVIGLEDWNTLTNGGEEITLENSEGTLIDRVEYNLTWYRNSNRDDGGYSLEQINPNFPCTSADNWIAADATQGGTPGAVNSVLDDTPDQIAPTLVQTTALNETTLRLTFSESMDQSSLEVLANYTLDQGIGIISASAEAPEFSSVILTLDPALVLGTIYTLNISNLSDCSGNTIDLQAITVALGSPPEFHQLIITEMMVDPRGDSQPLNPLPEAEFIELFNRSDQVLDLRDCSLEDEGGSSIFPQQAIFPGEYVIICENSIAPAFQEFGKVVGIGVFPDLSNGGEQLVFRNPEGEQVFAVLYSDSWYQNRQKSEGGWTLEMIDTDNPCGEASNWLASEAERGGTPGVSNSVMADRPDLTAPRLIRAEALDVSTIRLTFNERMDENSLNIAQYNLSPSVDVAQVIPQAPLFKQVFLNLGESLQAQTIYQIEVDNLSDCAGNLIGEDNVAQFGLAEPADSLDIILNELLFNPRTGGDDFVELYNNSDKFVDLNEWRLANVDEGIIANQRLITEERFIMAPQTFLVLTTDPQNIKSEYPLANEDNFLAIPSIPSYPDDEGTFILISNDDRLIERFDYSEDFHLALLDDDNGVSLERIAFSLPTNDGNTWQSAASTVGFATPGNANSQRLNNQIPAGRVRIEPQVFTPDGDGNQDFTTINLDFEQGGNVVDILIFDSRGREIRKLVQRQLIGTEQATFTWDGSNDNRQLARMGYYVAYIEVFKADGGTETYKEKIVLGKRF